MGNLFGSVYNMLSDLGLLAQKTVKGFFGIIFKALKFILHRFFIYPGARLKKRLAHSLFIVRRIALLLLVAVIIAVGVLSVRDKNASRDAVRIIYSGETVGYAESMDDVLMAKAQLFSDSGVKDTLTVDFEECKALRSEVLSTAAIRDLLLELSGKTLDTCYGVYIGGERVAVVKDSATAAAALEALLNQTKVLYPDSCVSFAENVTIKRTAVDSFSNTLRTASELLNYLKTYNLLHVTHTECKKQFSAIEYDTVEIETNKLFIGDTRVRRNGQNGKALVLKLVTYIGDKAALSEDLTSVTVNAPVSKVIERGIRAGSIAIGDYTVTQTSGFFCWPVVGLYTVTSNFGYRSLGYHHGLDISGASASGSLVVAGAAGTVSEAGWSAGGYGNYVVIDHGNGVETLYGHMLDNSVLVTAGDYVTKGQAIGRVGDTGYSFGAHLHFEVRINGVRVNPARYLGLE